MIIGLIDSGVGGFSILRAAQKALPQHGYVYLADQENFPYSKKSEDELAVLAKYPGPNWTVVGSTKLVNAIEKNDQTSVLRTLKQIHNQHEKTLFAGIVLGCTHFPLASEKIQAFWPNARLFSPSIGVVKQLSKLLPEAKLREQSNDPIFLTTPNYTHSTMLADRYQTII